MDMTKEELKAWQYKGYLEDVRKELDLPAEVDGVRFWINDIDSLCFRYKNSTGLVFPDNGYRGATADGRDFYPLLRISCAHNDECRYNPTCEPTLKAASAAIKKSWQDFISN